MPAGCVGASVCSLTKIIPSPLCLCLGASSEPTCGLSSMGPEWSQAWPGRWEARGQALSCRRPGDRLQASWLRPSSFGRPVSPHPANFRPHPPSFSTSSARTSVCSGNVAPSLPQRGFFPWCWLLCPNSHPWSSLWGVGLQGLLSSVPAWLWGLTLVPRPGPCLPPRAPAPCHLPPAVLSSWRPPSQSPSAILALAAPQRGRIWPAQMVCCWWGTHLCAQTRKV